MTFQIHAMAPAEAKSVLLSLGIPAITESTEISGGIALDASGMTHYAAMLLMDELSEKMGALNPEEHSTGSIAQACVVMGSLIGEGVTAQEKRAASEVQETSHPTSPDVSTNTVSAKQSSFGKNTEVEDGQEITGKPKRK